jgi:2,3-bisphosphoglycerate-dependent phosphoglycerate mutase
MIFYLIRHGESLYNAEGRIQGQSDVALSLVGLQQAQAIADALADEAIDAVFASPLRRAMQTAEPIAGRLGLSIHCDDRLKEIHAGIFQGLLWEEVESKFPDAAHPWREQQPDFVIPGGESRRALMERGRAVFESMRETRLRRVAVVSHGGILAAALKALLRIPAEINPFSFYNASISVLAWNDRIKLLSLNQLEHLRTAGLAREDSTGNV